MKHRIKLLVALSLLGIACSTTTTTPGVTTHAGDAGGGDDDDDDTTTGSHKDGGKSGGGDDDDDDDASTTPDAASPADAAKLDAAPKQVSCPLSFQGACGTCFATSCATPCGSCADDADCDAAMVCLASCTTETCDSACIDSLPQGSLALLNATIGSQGCLGTECESECVSATAKVGDPCSSDAQCISGSCNSRWCEPAAGCSENTQCGIDTEGELVWCVEETGGSNGCFPGCSTNADCALYSGTSCKLATATNGASAYICSL